MSYDFSALAVAIVDDNIHMRQLVRTLLVTMGVRRIEEAADGCEALDMLRAFAADIVICDLLMKPMDGITFVTKIRRSADSPNRFVPIIALTAFSARERVEAARDSGITEFLAKPINAQTLYARLLAVIEHPRPFVSTDTYFGPDRRRKKCADPAVYGSRRAEDRGQSNDVLMV